MSARRYAEIGPFMEAHQRPDQLLLDTNVIIDIRNFYFGIPQAPEIRHDLGELLLKYAAKGQFDRSVPDISFGFGLLEASWKRGYGPDSVAHAKFRHAVTTALWWNPEQVERNFANRHAPCNRDSRLRQGTLRSDVNIKDDHPGKLLAPSYGALLFLANIDRRRQEWKHKGPRWAFAQFNRWCTEELDLRGSYENQIAVDLFFGGRSRKDGARRLLKLGGSDTPDALAQKCWNAAWDIEFLRLSERYLMGEMPDQPGKHKIANIVTANVDPGFVRMVAQLTAIIKFDNATVPWAAHDFSGVDAKDIEFVRDLWQARDDSTSRNPRRIAEFSANRDGKVFGEVRKLERLAGVSISSLNGLNLAEPDS